MRHVLPTIKAVGFGIALYVSLDTLMAEMETRLGLGSVDSKAFDKPKTRSEIFANRSRGYAHDGWTSDHTLVLPEQRST